MSDEKFKLHPISAVINFITGLKDLILPFVIIFVSNGFKLNLNPHDEEFWADLVPLAIVGLLLILNLISGIVKWRRFVYWFEDGELRVEYGLFVKKKRYIPFERIQSLNYQEGIFHRPFGLVKVSVETAGSNDGKAEAELTAITRTAADMIEIEMKRTKREKRQVSTLNESVDEIGHDYLSEADVQLVANQQKQYTEENIQRDVIFNMSIKDLLVLATTSGGVGVVFSGLAAIASQFGNIIPYDYLYGEFQAFIKVGVLLIALVVFFVLLVAWALSVVLTLLSNYGFVVERENDKLIITRGLLERKRITIPINRIQGIKIVENPLRQMFGYATVVVESAGGAVLDKDKKIILMPLVKKGQAIAPLQQLFPEINWLPMLKRSPKKGRSFYYRIDFLWMLPLIALVSYFFFPYGLLSLIIIPLAMLLGMWQHKTAGYSVEGHQLTISYRSFSRTTIFMEKKRIQQMSLRQTYFQRKKDVASIGTTIMSGSMGSSAVIAHFEKNDMEKIMAWYKPNTKQVHDEQQFYGP